MHQNNRTQYKALLDSVFYENIISLNYKPLDWVHNDWLASLSFSQYFKPLKSAKMQNYVRHQLKIDNNQLSDFKDPLKRLIFLPEDKLERLMGVLGLTCFQNQLAILIERNVKNSLIDKLGAESIELVQQKIRLMIHEYPKNLEQKVPIIDPDTNQLECFFGYGLQLLIIATETQSSSWSQLLQYKLPKTNVSLQPNINLNKSEHSRLRLLIQKIGLEIEPECTNLVK